MSEDAKFKHTDETQTDFLAIVDEDGVLTVSVERQRARVPSAIAYLNEDAAYKFYLFLGKALGLR